MLCSLACGALLGVASCSKEQDKKKEEDKKPVVWHNEVALSAGEKLGGCAAGDLMPERPGREIVTVGVSGAVWIAWREPNGWKSEKIFTAPGEMIQAACGDVLVNRRGDEIVLVGMASGQESSEGRGTAWLLTRTDKWQAEQIHSDDRLLHGVCVTRDGVVVTGFTNSATLLIPKSGKLIKAKTVSLPGAGKSATECGDITVIACNDGTLAAIDWTKNAAQVLDKRSAGRARVSAEIGWSMRNSNHAFPRVAVADDDGTLSVVTIKKTDGKLSATSEVAHKEGKKLRGAVFAELDPDSKGFEAASAGYENKISILRRKSGGGFAAEVLHQEPERFHHLIAAEVDGRPNLELVACGYSGSLVVILRGGR